MSCSGCLVLKSVAGLVALVGVGFGGYNLATTGCPLGGCSTGAGTSPDTQVNLVATDATGETAAADSSCCSAPTQADRFAADATEVADQACCAEATECCSEDGECSAEDGACTKVATNEDLDTTVDAVDAEPGTD